MSEPVVAVRVPLRLGRGGNEREHHMVRTRRVKQERWVVGLVLNGKRRPELPCVVMLERVSPSGRQLDDDNLTGSLKAVRDEVARWLGVDDGDGRVRWVYAQARGKWEVGVVVQGDDVVKEVADGCERNEWGDDADAGDGA